MSAARDGIKLAPFNSSRGGGRSAGPYLVLVASLLITAGATVYVSRTLSTRDHLRFNTAANHARERIVARIDTYVAMLRGADGLFTSRFPVKREEFTLYVSRLELQKRYPGIQGIGFSVRFAEKDRDLLEKLMRAYGEPQFHTWPKGSNQDELHAIVYLEPRDERNRSVMGFDMYSEPVRREAMRRARDTGEPAASGKVRLKQEISEPDVQPGFLIYSPVYKGAAIPATVGKRRENLLGFVYSPFRGGDLFGAIFAQEVEPWLDFQIYDAAPDAGSDAALLFGSSGVRAGTQPRFAKPIAIDVAGRRWTLLVATRPQFQSAWTRMAVPITGFGGAALSLAFFLFARAQLNARMRAERLWHDLHKSQAALRQSESKFRRLSDANLVGVCFANIDGRILDANDEWLRIVGLPRDALGQPLRWQRQVAPEYLPRVGQAIAELRERGVTTPYELELLRPDGSRVPVLTGTAALEQTQGDAVSLVVDLTTRKEAERQLLAAKEAADAARREAETANRLKDEFLATVSHELRTPLNAILGWTQLLCDPRAEPRDLAHGLSVIDRNARAQAQLVDDLLDVSRIIAGKLRLDFQPVDFSQVVDAAVQTVRPTAEVKGVKVLENLARPCWVAGDAARLQQVAWNLLSNAVKFTPRGGRVQVEVFADSEEAHLIVRDTGKGITGEFLPYVFERFRQGDSSTTRKFGGLGLGLGIVRHLVQLHGGTVTADSEGENKGATFTVSLPLSAPTTSSPKTTASSATSGTLAGVHVLIVEDEPDTRELLTRFLAEADARVSTATCAAEGLASYRSGSPDVIVSDISMPDEDGYAMMRKIRAAEHRNGARRNVPAIALTAYARPEDRDRALAAGFQLHVPKPVRKQDVLAAIATAMR